MVEEVIARIKELIEMLETEPSQENELSALHLKLAIDWQEYKRSLPSKRYEKPPELPEIVQEVDGVALADRLR